MRFCTYTLRDTSPDPVTGVARSQTEAFDDVARQAVWAEELAFDGFGWGSGTRSARGAVRAPCETGVQLRVESLTHQSRNRCTCPVRLCGCTHR